MKKLICSILAAFTLNSYAQQVPPLVPAPAEISIEAGLFAIDDKTIISIAHPGLAKEAAVLQAFVKSAKGYNLKIQQGENKGVANQVLLSVVNDPVAGPEGYSLVATAKYISIVGSSNSGLFYGLQTLFQLASSIASPGATAKAEISIPAVTIKDAPRFRYRGMHFDVARHFSSVDFVKKYIDYLAAYKFNTFHFHLTDDQGWRIEIKKYPRLTSVGGFRNGTIVGRYPGTSNDSLRYGGYYTQEEIKDIVRYAAEKHITVIPEIEMPGHASAAIAAYPELSCFPKENTKILATTPWAGPRQGKQLQQTWGVFEDVFCPTEYTFKFLENVMNEVMALFPSTYMHIGGDECPKESWKRSAFCQQLIKTKKLRDEHGLQSYFIQRMEKYINSKGRKIIGWDEILEGGLAPNATVMSWRGEEGGIKAAKQKHDVIMTPGNWLYFDHSQSTNEDSVTIGNYTPLEEVYSYDPLPAALGTEGSKYILGAQANLWTEYMKNPMKVEYMLFPRITALSEVLWSPKEKRSWPNFEAKLPWIFEQLQQKNINYSKAFYELKATVLPSESNNGVLWKLESTVKEPITVSFGTDSSWIYNGLQSIPTSVTSATASFKGTKLTQQFHFNKATGKKITLEIEPSKGFPGDGAFTLVNGVQNIRALTKSREFIGFSGKDLTAVIDLGEKQAINEIVLHAFEQTGSWIYRPTSVSFYSSDNGTDFTLLETIISLNGNRHLLYRTRKSAGARFVKVTAKNPGTIASGKPGSGNPAWVFFDEIEVK